MYFVQNGPSLNPTRKGNPSPSDVDLSLSLSLSSHVYWLHFKLALLGDERAIIVLWGSSALF